MAHDRTLLLIPTALERDRLLALSPDGLPAPRLCGLGPTVAAARTATLISEERPSRVLLLGIAGTFEPQALALGSATAFSQVELDTPDLGMDLFPGEGTAPPLGGALPLQSEDASSSLLTVSRPSEDRTEAMRRHQRFPRCVAEDMEGWAVACACALADVPLVIVRGISNVVGDRDRNNWDLDGALAAAASTAAESLEGS